jgi:hypothetical protein
MRSVTALCVLLVGCGPVLLFGDQTPGQGALPPPASPDSGIAHGSAGATASAGAPASTSDAAGPRALIAVTSFDCGRCFDVVASGTGGLPPYRFEWDDGSQNPQRRVCADAIAVPVTVIVEDATSARSAPDVTLLESEADAGCAPPQEPVEKLCVMNPSFEGTPSVNVGVPQTFDAPPWSACVDAAAMAAGASNTPDIANDTFLQTPISAPKPIDGNTYLALGPGEQASQALCSILPAGTASSFQLDLTRVNLNPGGVPDVGTTFLEIWGGLVTDCSQRQLLWASPALDVGWKRYCVKLKPLELLDQITLRASSDMLASATAYLLVDNLVTVDDCP